MLASLMFIAVQGATATYMFALHMTRFQAGRRVVKEQSMVSIKEDESSSTSSCQAILLKFAKHIFIAAILGNWEGGLLGRANP